MGKAARAKRTPKRPTSVDAASTQLEISTLVSGKTLRGFVNLRLGVEETQMDVAKARHVQGMLGEAIEAAITDELLVAFLTSRVGLTLDKAVAALADFRELRQGSRDVINPA